MATPVERLRIFKRGCLVGYAVILILFIGLKIVAHSISTRIKGTVVALRSVSSASGRGTQFMPVSYGESPVVSYTVPGIGYTITNEEIGFFNGAYNVGDKIDIFYYPWDVDHALLYNFRNYWLNISTVILLLLALLAWTAIWNIMNMKDDERIKIPIDPMPPTSF